MTGDRDGSSEREARPYCRCGHYVGEHAPRDGGQAGRCYYCKRCDQATPRKGVTK